MTYGFGYDDELPGGYQDTDLEMLELEEAAREQERDPLSADYEPTAYEREPTPEEEEACALIEYDHGQLALSAHVEERGQLVIEECAAAPIPAPLNHTPERPAAELHEARVIGPSTKPDGTPYVQFSGPLESAEEIAASHPALRVEAPTRSAREYRCAYCGRKLKTEEWIYSRHTGSRYCLPGEGCNTPAQYRKQERRRS